MLWCTAEVVLLMSLPSTRLELCLSASLSPYRLLKPKRWLASYHHIAGYGRSSRFSISVDVLRSRRGGGDGTSDDRGWVAWEEKRRQRIRASWLSQNPMSGGVPVVNEEGHFSDRYNHTLQPSPYHLKYLFTSLRNTISLIRPIASADTPTTTKQKPNGTAQSTNHQNAWRSKGSQNPL